MQVAIAVARMRDSDVQKPPGIAEAIDWLAALDLLGVDALDADGDRPHAGRGAQVRRGPGGDPRGRPRVSSCGRHEGRDGLARPAGDGRRLRAAPARRRAADDAGALGRAGAGAGARAAGGAAAAVLDRRGRSSSPTRPRCPDFDAVFAAVFRGYETGRRRGARRSPRGAPPGHRGTAVSTAIAASAARSRSRWRMASDEERLAEKRFDALEPHELAQLYALMTRLRLETPERRTPPPRAGAPRRASTCGARCAAACAPAVTRSGSPAGAAASSGAGSCCSATSPARWSRMRAPTSSSPRVRAARPNAEGVRVRDPPDPAHARRSPPRNPERAIQRAAETAPDWSSGTRIGDARRPSTTGTGGAGWRAARSW